MSPEEEFVARLARAVDKDHGARCEVCSEEVSGAEGREAVEEFLNEHLHVRHAPKDAKIVYTVNQQFTQQ